MPKGLTDNNPARIVVMGSAHWDTLAYAGHIETGGDGIGHIQIECGGTGYLAARSLVLSGYRVTLLTDIGDDTPSTLIYEDLRRRGVQLAVVRHPALNGSGFVATLTAHGVHATVSSLPIAHREISVERIVAALSESSGVIADASHSSISLSRLTTACRERGLPCLIGGVSPQRITLIAPLSPPPTAWVLSAREAHALWRHRCPQVDNYPEVARLIGCPLFVMRPNAGLAYVTAKSVQTFAHDALAADGQRLGSRAHLMAQLLAGFLRTHHWESAVTSALSVPDPGLGASPVLQMVASSRDPLTGLLRRDCFLKDLQDALDERMWDSYSLTLVFIDLNHFKSLNDQYGHLFGDQVLSTVAEALYECMPTKGALARWGGDEFVGFVFTKDAPDFLQRLQAIQQVTAAGVTVPIGLTIGTYHVAAHSDTAALEAVHRADQSMYAQRQQRIQ